MLAPGFSSFFEFGGGENDLWVIDEDRQYWHFFLKKGITELKEAIDSVLSKMAKDDFSEMMDEGQFLYSLWHQLVEGIKKGEIMPTDFVAMCNGRIPNSTVCLCW